MHADLVSVSWNDGTTSNTNDRVLFWQLGTSPPSTTYVSTAWAYTYGGQKSIGGASSISGSVNITAPSVVGSYTVYYCINSGYICTASVQVTVVGE